MGGASPALAATLDVVLEEFFRAERSEGDDNGPSLECELNKDEVGSKRFSVEPLWKDAALIPPYYSEKGTREALRSVLSLERKINLVKIVG